MILTQHTADKKVERLKAEGWDVEWDGWTLLIFKPNDSGWRLKNGAFRNGKWNTVKRYKVQKDGKYYLNNVRFKRDDQ